MAAKFEIKKATDGQFYFHLKAANGELILASELYKAKSGAENGIASVKTNAPQDARYDRRVAANGKHYFVLKAANHEIIGTSQQYSSAPAMENGISSVKDNAPSAPISDLT
ncbi:MAG TPA: YegP family protein [Thermoanaerobaculia bacterium]|nr:YegP family protein [Thermoanaerobaculia bacterium]